MSDPPSATPDRYSLLLDFPVRLYTAIRTIRIYPASNPQVQRSNEFVVKAFQALLENEADDSVNLAFSEGKIVVCGELLPDKDQTRPQIQGLVTLFNRLRIHSLSFDPNFSFDDCATFIHTLSALLSKKKLTEPLAVLLDKAGIASVSVDAKRYVAIREGEQVIRDELIGSGLNISDEELANFVLGKTEQDPLLGISPDLVQELINRLPATGGPHLHPEDERTNVIDFLRTLSKETDFRKHYDEIEKSARALSGLDPSLLANLIATLPTTLAADAMLGSTLHQLSPQQLNTLISKLVAQQSLATPGRTQVQVDSGSLLNRLAGLEKEREPEIKKAIAQNIDARTLQVPLETLPTLPDQLAMRLQQTSWATPVLVAAARQSTDPRNFVGERATVSSFEHMLKRYDSLLDSEKQLQVATQVASELATFDEKELGLLLVRKYKTLFGEQLYRQVISQLSEEKLAKLINHFQALAEGRTLFHWTTSRITILKKPTNGCSKLFAAKKCGRSSKCSAKTKNSGKNNDRKQ